MKVGKIDIKIDDTMPDDMLQITHSGGTTYWNLRTGASVTLPHPTVTELCERVQFVPTTAREGERSVSDDRPS